MKQYREHAKRVPPNPYNPKGLRVRSKPRKKPTREGPHRLRRAKKIGRKWCQMHATRGWKAA